MGRKATGASSFAAGICSRQRSPTRHHADANVSIFIFVSFTDVGTLAENAAAYDGSRVRISGVYAIALNARAASQEYNERRR